jgi:hypothetical protein
MCLSKCLSKGDSFSAKRGGSEFAEESAEFGRIEKLPKVRLAVNIEQ